MARFKWDTIILFSEQLATAAQLNLPLDRTISSMAAETHDRSWREAQQRMAKSVQEGNSLADAMDEQAVWFPVLLRRFARLGVEGKSLPAMLRRASQSLQTARDIQQKLFKTLIYPLLIWTILLVQLGVILIFVTPKFAEMLDTAAMSGLGDSFLWQFGPMVLILGDALLFYLAWLVISVIGSEVEGRNRMSVFADLLVTRIPLIGTLHRHAKAAELCETMGVLIKAGYTGKEAVAIVKDTIRNPAMFAGLEEIDTALLAGEHYKVESRGTLIPHTTLWMLASSGAGEALGECFLNLAEQHRRQLGTLSNFVREIIEPLLLLAIAVTAGMMLVALYMTIFVISGDFVNNAMF